MEANGLGPFASVEVVTQARGMKAINHFLGEGWKILALQWCDEPMTGHPNSKHWQMQYALMGKAIAAGEIGDRVRADANAYNEAQEESARLREEDLLQDVPALVDEPEKVEPVAPIASRQRGPAQKKVVRQPGSLGETQLTGLRG